MLILRSVNSMALFARVYSRSVVILEKPKEKKRSNMVRGGLRIFTFIWLRCPRLCLFYMLNIPDSYEKSIVPAVLNSLRSAGDKPDLNSRSPYFHGIKYYVDDILGGCDNLNHHLNPMELIQNILPIKAPSVLSQVSHKPCVSPKRHRLLRVSPILPLSLTGCVKTTTSYLQGHH